MSITLMVRDESATGESYNELPIELASERITVRDLIRERVRQEVNEFNRRQGEQNFQGLVQPTDTERVLNGRRIEFRLKTPKQIDWTEQYARAVDAFGRGGFFLLVGDKQVEDLEQELIIDPDTRVSFVKLVPLVGG